MNINYKIILYNNYTFHENFSLTGNYMSHLVYLGDFRSHQRSAFRYLVCLHSLEHKGSFIT